MGNALVREKSMNNPCGRRIQLQKDKEQMEIITLSLLGKDIIDPEEFAEAYLDGVYIESVKRSKLRTIILINMIETAVEKLEKTMDKDKFNAFKKMYMEQENKQYRFNERLFKVGEQCQCSDRTIRRWVNDILTELSKKLIGAERMLSDL